MRGGGVKVVDASAGVGVSVGSAPSAGATLQHPHTEVRGATALLTRPQDLVLRETERFSHYGRDINDANSTELMKDRGHSSSSVRSMSSQSLDTAAPGSMGSSIEPNAVQ